MVLASRTIEGLQVNSVAADNVNGGLIAANHLIRLGHTKIAFFAGYRRLFHHTRQDERVFASDGRGRFTR